MSPFLLGSELEVLVLNLVILVLPHFGYHPGYIMLATYQVMVNNEMKNERHLDEWALTYKFGQL